MTCLYHLYTPIGLIGSLNLKKSQCGDNVLLIKETTDSLINKNVHIL